MVRLELEVGNRPAPEGLYLNHVQSWEAEVGERSLHLANGKVVEGATCQISRLCLEMEEVSEYPRKQKPRS